MSPVRLAWVCCQQTRPTMVAVTWELYKMISRNACAWIISISSRSAIPVNVMMMMMIMSHAVYLHHRALLIVHLHVTLILTTIVCQSVHPQRNAKLMIRVYQCVLLHATPMKKTVTTPSQSPMHGQKPECCWTSYINCVKTKPFHSKSNDMWEYSFKMYHVDPCRFFLNICLFSSRLLVAFVCSGWVKHPLWIGYCW